MYPTNEKEALEALKGDDPELAATAEAVLWSAWCRSGDAETDRVFRAGVEAMQQQQLTNAEELFSRVIELKPRFAEGWNKRATVYYLAGDYKRSIADCGEVLKRNPRHFGALSGLGQIYLQLEQYDESLAWFRKALDVNPNMVGVEFNIKRIETLRKERRGTQI